MILRQQDGIEWLEFELLADVPEVVHGVFLRKGGVSGAPYHSLNFSFQVNDDPIAVTQNEEKVKNILEISRVVRGKLVHGNQVVCVEDEETPLNKESDGFITSLKGTGLLVTHADCQACLFYDPMKKVIGNVHCGWRGNVANIYGEAVRLMQKRYGSRPADLLACISPSLGPCCAQFQNYRTELPSHFLKYQVVPDYFDLWAVAEEQLTDCGLLPHHMEFAEICTFSNPDDFYSYRRDKLSGRNGTVIALR